MTKQLNKLMLIKDHVMYIVGGRDALHGALFFVWYML